MDIHVKLLEEVQSPPVSSYGVPDKLIKRDFTLPDRSGTGRGPVGDREEACYVAR